MGAPRCTMVLAWRFFSIINVAPQKNCYAQNYAGLGIIGYDAKANSRDSA